MEKVAIIKIFDIQTAIENGFELIDGYDVENEGKIVIKPNLCHFSSPETGRTTDVRIVRGVIDYLLQRAPSSIFVVESDTYARTAEKVFKKLGYTELETNKVKIVNLTKYPDTIEQGDHIISMGKLKTMLFEGISGAYKNLFGMIPKKEKRFLHPFISEVLYELKQKYSPDLCIIDGYHALEGCGPVNGFPKPTKLLIFGKNCVTTDAVACHVMGLNPFDVPHLAYAYEKGYGELEINKIQIVGERLEDVRSDFMFVPKRAFDFMRQGLKLGRYPPPVRNLGMLWFTFGNWHAGKLSSRKELPVRRTLKNIMARNWKV